MNATNEFTNGDPFRWDYIQTVSFQEVADAIYKTKKKYSSGIKQAFDSSYLRNLYLVEYDTNHWAVDEDTWMKILSYNETNREIYRKEVFDCDNFAMYFAATVQSAFRINGVGIVFDDSCDNAYNCLLVRQDDDSLKFMVIDPVDDAIITESIAESATGNYKAEEGYVFLT